MGQTRDLFKKIRDTKGTFHAKTDSVKDRNGIDLTEAEEIKKRWQEHTEELKLKKVGKTTRPFRYDLNQTPYDYTEKVTNRLKGLDLVDRVPEELWTETHNTVPKIATKNHPKDKEIQEGKMVLVTFCIVMNIKVHI